MDRDTNLGVTFDKLNAKLQVVFQILSISTQSFSGDVIVTSFERIISVLRSLFSTCKNMKIIKTLILSPGCEGGIYVLRINETQRLAESERHFIGHIIVNLRATYNVHNCDPIPIRS